MRVKLSSESCAKTLKRIEKENELRLALSEMSTFEKEGGRIESEKSSAVLVKLRVTTVEKEAEAALEAEKSAWKPIETSCQDEIKKRTGMVWRAYGRKKKS